MEDNITAIQLECTKLRKENETSTKDVTHERILFHKNKEIVEKQRSLYDAKLKEKDDLINKLQQQVDALTQVNSGLRSKYHNVTSENLELQHENRHLTRVVSDMSDTNDTLQRYTTM
jgi:regulator of replication initiation timing